MRQHAAVIGGGISGLATSMALTRMGHRVTLFENTSDLGGLAATFPYRGGHLEKFYHCLLPTDHALLRLVREVGLEHDLRWRETKMGFMYQGRMFALNNAIDLLRFTPLTLIERLRLGLMGLRARTGGLSPALDEISAAEWIRGMVGDRGFEVLWKPLLAAKIGDHYAALPALWLSSRMNREKNSGPERKGYLLGGYRSLIAALASTLRERGTVIRLSQPVTQIVESEGRMALRLPDGGLEVFDFVVSTVPLKVFQQLASGLRLPGRLAELKLDYQGVVSGVFMTRQPLSHYYWMPWVDCGATSQGAIEMTNLVPRERAGGLHINYLVNYTHRDSEIYRADDGVVLGRYRDDLARLFPAAGASIEDAFLFRAPHVEPMWTVGYSRVRPESAVIPGRLYLSCTAQVYPRVNSWNSCCELVEDMSAPLGDEVSARAVAERAVGTTA